MKEYPGRIAIQQRVLPNYRVPFFDTLAGRCRGGLSLFSGQPLESESIPTGHLPKAADWFEGENIHMGSPSDPYYVCHQANLLDWIKQTNADLLIVEANPRYNSTFPAIKWMHESGRPVLGWGLGVPASKGAGATLARLGRNRLFRLLDGMLAYSTRGAEEYARTGLLPKDRIFVAFNAVAPPPTHPAAEPGSRPGKRTVLFVGRLQRRKRLEDLFRACAGLDERLRPSLVIVGDGPDRGILERAAAEIYPAARFTGHLSGDALAAEFHSADLFVLPGTGGLAVQEAMSWGLPVIVAEGDGTQQDLVRPGNGWLIPPGEQAALHRALEEALSDPAGLARRGAESRRITLQEINIEKMAERFVEAALSVTGGS